MNGNREERHFGDNNNRNECGKIRKNEECVGNIKEFIMVIIENGCRDLWETKLYRLELVLHWVLENN